MSPGHRVGKLPGRRVGKSKETANLPAPAA